MAAIAGNRPAAESKKSVQVGHVAADKKGWYSIADRIEQQMSDSFRYLCQVLGYTLEDVRGMDCYQFHRELLAAQAQQEQQRKQVEKWQKKL